MNFRVSAKLKYHWPRILQIAGYHTHQEGYVKRLAGDYYPRWHVYLRQEDENVIEFNIHLDQRKGVHEGATAHAAEYDGELVLSEMNRLIELFTSNYI